MKNILCLFFLLTLTACREPSVAMPNPDPKNVTIAEEAIVGNEDEYRTVLTLRAADSDERKIIAAFDKAENIEIISLEPWFETPQFRKIMDAEWPEGMDEKEQDVFESLQIEKQKEAMRMWCAKSECIDENRVLGKISVQKTEQRDFLANTIRGWLESAPNYASACIPSFHHGIAFESEGKKIVLLLCYGCGQYQILVDGKKIGGPQNGGIMSGDVEMNRLFKAAGIKFHQQEV